MAKVAVFYAEGERIEYVAGANILAGAVVPLTNRCGVAVNAIANTATGVLAVCGIWTLPSVTNAAFAVGDALFWDVDNQVVTKVAATMIPLGTCTLTKLQATATANVDIGLPRAAIKAANVAALSGSSTVAHVETGVNAILTALKTANLMASS